MAEQSSFEEQRALLLGDVAASMENVLQNINKLNRNLEGIIAVGNEFGQVESLWSQFETVMGNGESKSQEQGAGRESRNGLRATVILRSKKQFEIDNQSEKRDSRLTTSPEYAAVIHHASPRRLAQTKDLMLPRIWLSIFSQSPKNADRDCTEPVLKVNIIPNIEERV